MKGNQIYRMSLLSNFMTKIVFLNEISRSSVPDFASSVVHVSFKNYSNGPKKV